MCICICANWQTGHQREKNHNIIMETYYLRVLLAGLSVVSSMATALCIYYNQIYLCNLHCTPYIPYTKRLVSPICSHSDCNTVMC